jgi:hypothetical protein
LIGVTGFFICEYQTMLMNIKASMRRNRICYAILCIIGCFLFNSINFVHAQEAGQFPWDENSARVAGRLLTLQIVLDSEDHLPSQDPGESIAISGASVQAESVDAVSLGGLGMSRFDTRIHDQMQRQRWQSSQRMAQMQDLRFKNAQILSRSMSRMQDMRWKHSQMLSQNMTRMHDTRWKTQRQVEDVRRNARDTVTKMRGLAGYVARNVYAGDYLLHDARRWTVEAELGGALMGGALKTIRWARTRSPYNIRFTQNSIKNKFGNGRSLDIGIGGLKSGKTTTYDIEPIRIFKKNRKIYTLDNRRLYVFQEANVRIRTKWATSREIARESWKFTTKNQGTSIRVRRGL